jgi:prefoldin subunit 5
VDTTLAEGAPLSLEDRIEAMEALQEEITQRIQELQARARTIRLRAGGGEWAQ